MSALNQYLFNHTTTFQVSTKEIYRKDVQEYEPIKIDVMKKFAVIIGLISLSTFGYAQGQRPDRPQPPSIEERISKAKTELNLTDEQVVQWKEIHSRYESAMKDRSDGEAAREEMTAELKATLTEEQLTKFKEQPKGKPQRR